MVRDHMWQVTMTVQSQDQIKPPLETGVDAINLTDFLKELWRTKWVILFFSTLFAMLGGIYAFALSTHVYQARTDLILDTRQEQIVDLETVIGGLSGDSSIVNSEVEILRARGLMERVARRLQLSQDREFNPGQAAIGFPRQFLENTGLLPANIRSDDQQFHQTVDTLLAQTHVRNIPFSLVFAVTVETNNPQKSALIADTIANTYIQDQLDRKILATEQATQWLTTRVEELRIDLEQAEQQANTFSAGTDLISTENLQALERQLKDQRQRSDAARTEALDLSGQLQALDHAETPAEQSAILASPTLTALYHAWRVQQDPDLKERFDTQLEQLRNALEFEATRRGTQAQALEAAQQRLQQRITGQAQDLIRLQQLERETTASRELYEHFLTRLKETAAQQGFQRPDSRVLSPAVVPTNPSAPRHGLIILISALVGLMPGIGLAAFRQMTYLRCSNPSFIEHLTGYPVLGDIPAMKHGYPQSPNTTGADLRDVGKIRNLRTSLLLSTTDNPPCVILITAPQETTATSAAAFCLAASFAEADHKTLFIDTAPTSPQPSDFLVGCDLHPSFPGDIPLQQSHIALAGNGIDVLHTNTATETTRSFYETDTFSTLLKTARQNWETILICAPPVLTAPDARILAKLSDITLVSIDWNSTKRTDLISALHLLDIARISPAGLIMNHAAQT